MTSPKGPSLSTPTARAGAAGALPKPGRRSPGCSAHPRSRLPILSQVPLLPRSGRNLRREVAMASIHPSLLLLGEELSEQMRNSKTPRIKSLNRGMARETLRISAVPEDYSHPNT